MANIDFERDRNEVTYRALMHDQSERDNMLRIYQGVTSLLLDILQEMRSISESVSGKQSDA